MTKIRIVHDESALVDLVEEHEYLSESASVEIADKYISGLLETAERITQFPKLGKSEPWIAKRLKADPEQIRSFRYRNHRCIYLLRGDGKIYILGYIHGKRAQDKALRERILALIKKNA